MARKLRFYGKKRGHRRTGSSTAGSVGEAVFFAALLLLGCGALGLWFAFRVVPQWRVNHEFRESTCRITESRIHQKKGEDGTLYRPEFTIEYEVDGHTRTSGWTYDIVTARNLAGSYLADRQAAEKIREQYTAGPDRPQRYPCWYDPASPDVVVLVRKTSWWIWLVLVVPVSFVIIGSGGLIYRLLRWGKSTEHQAAVTQRVQQHAPFKTNVNSTNEFPNIPNGADIINSPGTRLRFRLPIATSPGWVLFGTLVACLAWNGIVAVLVAIAVRGHFSGHPDWFLTLFVVPFAVVGIFLIAVFSRQLLATTGIGPTQVELSSHPLQPGGSCELFLSQSGRLQVDSIEVLLVCEEEATYRQGTNTRTETRQVQRHQIFRHEGFEVHRGQPFETECELQVPAGAMHSFKASHNRITWKVVVNGDIVGWPRYTRSFPVIVRPGSEDNSS